MRTLQLIFLLLGALNLVACDSGSNEGMLGTLERDRVAHTATVNEVIVSMPVAPGSKVEKGTLLAQLDNTLQLAMVAQANAKVAEAEANLTKLQNGAREEDIAAARANVAGANAALVASNANFLREKEIVERNLDSKANLDRMRARRDKDKAALSNAEETLLRLTNGTREEDLDMGAAQLRAAKAVLDNENKKLEDLSIRATRAGILDNLPWNEGERVTVGSVIAVLLAGEAPYARIYVPEKHRLQLKVGDPLMVHLDGLDESISAELRWISSEAAFSPYYALSQGERSHLVYLAEVQLPKAYSHLPNGIPAQVTLP